MLSLVLRPGYKPRPAAHPAIAESAVESNKPSCEFFLSENFGKCFVQSNTLSQSSNARFSRFEISLHPIVRILLIVYQIQSFVNITVICQKMSYKMKTVFEFPFCKVLLKLMFHLLNYEIFYVVT